MNWKHGYYADSGYVYGYYPETMPMRLRWAALAQGQEAPSRQFRYLDAGCGQGFNLILAAAAHPESEFVGLDFMPGHIAHGRDLAKRCGLSNIRFLEADFVHLAAEPAAIKALGDFDYVVCHGIATWISPAVKAALFSLVGQVLKPGGIFYNSYNTLPGWLNVTPFQHLVRLQQQGRKGGEAIATARAIMDSLLEQGSLAQHFPTLKARITSLTELDPAYLVQELNNQFWQPVFVSQMIDDMSAVKLDYLGTATLGDIYLDAFPPEVLKLIEQESGPRLKQQIRDYAVYKSFRRDLYVKGLVPLWRERQAEQLLDTRFISNPAVPRPEAGRPYKLTSGLGDVDGDYERCSAIVEQMDTPEGLSLRELRLPDKDIGIAHIIKTVSLLLQGWWLMPYAPTKPMPNVNLGITHAVCEGAPYRSLSVPRAGGAVYLTDLEMMFANASLRGLPEADWPQVVAARLQALGGTLIQEGTKVTNPKAGLDLIATDAKKFQSRLPWLKAVGGL